VLTASGSADREDRRNSGAAPGGESEPLRRRILVDIGNSGLKIAGLGPDRQLQQVRRLPWRFEAAVEPAGKVAGGSLSVDGQQLESWLLEWRAAWQRGADGAEAGPDAASLKPSIDAALGSLNRTGHAPEPPALWWISSVNPIASQRLADVLARRWGGEPVVWVSTDQVPMRVDLEPSSGLGIDRLLAAWGAYSRLQPETPLVVVQAGTALTVDWVSREGVFEGGAILPGAAMTLGWLARGTARLPELSIPEDWERLAIPGRNTAQAMAVGCIAGLCGGLSWIVERYRHNQALPVPVVISGGDAERLVPHVPPPVCSHPDLVLHGLAACAAEADPTRSGD
jgi:type III pantothenate kinase